MHDPKFRFGTGDTITRREDGTTIPADEPGFYIRGKDEAGIPAIERYIEVMEAQQTPASRAHAQSARAQLAVIVAWQAANPGQVGMGCATGRERLNPRGATACKHPKARIHKGLCGACGQNVTR